MSESPMTSGFEPYPTDQGGRHEGYGAPSYEAYPPHAAYYYGPPPTAPTGLAVAAVVLAGVYSLVQVLSFATSWSAADQYADLARRGADSATLFTTYDAVNLLLPLVGVAAYVVTCLWLTRARKTATTLTQDVPQARSVVWVWLGWWVPIVSFWFPYQVVRDIRRATRLRDSAVLGFWWAFWLVTLLASQVAGNLVPTSGVPDQDLVDALPWAEAVLTAATLGALVLWCVTVRDIARAQRRLTGV